MAEVQADTTANQPVNEPAPSQEHGTPEAPTGGGTGVGFVVIIAVVIAAGLVALGFSIYDAKDEPKPSADTVQSSLETLDRSSPVDEQVLSEEESQIDQTVRDLDNISDFNEDELSDQSLGL